jgi:hypothetical protein
MPAMGDAWAAAVVHELVARCGERLPALWKIRLTPSEAPALSARLRHEGVRLGDLLRHPEQREQELEAMVLIVSGEEGTVLGPGPDHLLVAGDELLLAGRPESRWALGTTLQVQASSEYVLTGERLPVGWLWRRLSSRRGSESRAAGGR